MSTSNNNEFWMTSLPEDVRNLPIINLAIPGSHNSMTYGITSKSQIGPDADVATRRLYFFFPILVRRWAKTQSATLWEQLQFGIRYFDFRVCQKDGKFYYVHGLYSMELFEPLEQLRQFLNTHPDEIVVLDFQHNYAMELVHHKELQQKLIELFGKIFYTAIDGSLQDCTLQRCKDLGKQVILIYRRSPLQLPREFWPSFSWPIPWPNVASIKKLQDFLGKSLLTRQRTQGYVSQCILTPTPRYIALRFLSSLRKTAKRVDKQLEPWIECQTPGPFNEKDTPKVNVFLADFINLKDGQFCNWVIQLNLKLYKTSADYETDETEGNSEETLAL